MSTVVGIHAVSWLNFSYSWAGSPKTGTSAWLTMDGHCCCPLSLRRRAASVLLAELSEPDIGALCNEYGCWHPCRVLAELFVFMGGIAENGNIGVADDGRPLLLSTFSATACGLFSARACLNGRRVELHPDGKLFFAKDLTGDHQIAIQTVTEQGSPKFT